MTSKRIVSRREFLKAAGIAVASSGLAACAAPPAPAPQAPSAPQATEASQAGEAVQPTTAPAVSTGEKVKIRVHDLVPDDATGPNAFPREQQKEFAQQFPDIEVEHLPFPDVNVEKRGEYWITALQGGAEGPSAVRFDNHLFTIQMASIGLAEPLDDYIKLYFPEWQDVAPVVQAISKYDGKIYQIPGLVEGQGYVVRRDYLKEAGLEEGYEPKEWDDWAAMVKKLTNDKHQGFMWNWMLGNFIDANGGATAIENPDKTIQLTFTAKENQEAIQFIHGLLHPINYAAKDPFADFGAQLNDFQQGNLAVFPFFPSWLNWLFGQAKFQPEDLSFYAYPIGPSGKTGNTLVKPWTWISTTSWMINPNQSPERKDAAARYICWLNSIDQVKQQAAWWKDNELKGVFPSPFKSVPWTDVSTGVPAWWKDTVGILLERGGVSSAPDFQGGTYWDAGIEKIMRDPQGNIEAHLKEAQDITQREWLDEYHKKLKTS